METRTYYSLNDPGREIWRLVDVASSADDVALGLTRIFDVRREEALSLVVPFLERLAQERLLVDAIDSPTPNPPEQAQAVSAPGKKLSPPDLIKHDEPLHEVPISPFDPQLPLAE